MRRVFRVLTVLVALFALTWVVAVIVAQPAHSEPLRNAYSPYGIETSVRDI